MKRLGFIIVALLVAGSAFADQNYKLPELHTIMKATLSPSYGCRSNEEHQKGYQKTVLLLSTRSNGPDLQFNGACGGKDYFVASTAGDDMSLIADLGTGVQLEDISAQRAFNLRGVHEPSNYTRFAQWAPVELDHTYAVLLNNSLKRGLFLFTVTGYTPNARVDLRYVVKEYQLLRGVEAQSPGFSWDRKNSVSQEQPSIEKVKSNQ